MKRRKQLIGLVAALVVLCNVGFAYAAEETAEEVKVMNKIVTVKTYEGLMPPTLSSQPGTTVIWVNHSPQPVEILFLDKKVVLACGSPVNFFVGKDGAYESAKIPFGGTASLCFTEKGKYEYVFKASATFYPMDEKEHRGIIWIK
jgi:plastocyanin